MSVELVVAVAENGVIGRVGGLPWRLSTDLKRFKALTLGKPIVMGRKTWESLGRPLPGRRNIVVTRRADYEAEGAECVSSLAVAMALAGAGRSDADVCVIGGGEIYREALPLADRLHVTHVHADIEGDTYFPPIDPETWEPVSREEVPAGEKDVYATSYVVYQRR
ncbi:dihydrofolate reductase [Nitratireductor sp. ZSWI3]|uniref:dihydrofolate reductase n=1 Tax=Nitratireductor sp. ZSWI3 TaxID=2966359 RepID=UPI0021503584|nr:dihydrofolate reductase [Nitratireductor sp. ZSWI3]MCR4267127.1 dihydrofolate reductase [Nitratireductor sp. ZSWI3]